MLGLNLNEMVVFMVALTLTGQLLVVALIAVLIWHKSLHHTARMALSAVGFLELLRIGYWSVVMLMVLNYGV